MKWNLTWKSYARKKRKIRKIFFRLDRPLDGKKWDEEVEVENLLIAFLICSQQYCLSIIDNRRKKWDEEVEVENLLIAILTSKQRKKVSSQNLPECAFYNKNLPECAFSLLLTSFGFGSREIQTSQFENPKFVGEIQIPVYLRTLDFENSQNFMAHKLAFEYRQNFMARNIALYFVCPKHSLFHKKTYKRESKLRFVVMILRQLQPIVLICQIILVRREFFRS